jgi:hypothetical protein
MKKGDRPTENKEAFETPKIIATFEKQQLEEAIRPHLSFPGYQ